MSIIVSLVLFSIILALAFSLLIQNKRHQDNLNKQKIKLWAEMTENKKKTAENVKNYLPNKTDPDKDLQKHEKNIKFVFDESDQSIVNTVDLDDFKNFKCVLPKEKIAKLKKENQAGVIEVNNVHVFIVPGEPGSFSGKLTFTSANEPPAELSTDNANDDDNDNDNDHPMEIDIYISADGESPTINLFEEKDEVPQEISK